MPGVGRDLPVEGSLVVVTTNVSVKHPLPIIICTRMQIGCFHKNLKYCFLFCIKVRFSDLYRLCHNIREGAGASTGLRGKDGGEAGEEGVGLADQQEQAEAKEAHRDEQGPSGLPGLARTPCSSQEVYLVHT